MVQMFSITLAHSTLMRRQTPIRFLFCTLSHISTFLSAIIQARTVTLAIHQRGTKERKRRAIHQMTLIEFTRKTPVDNNTNILLSCLDGTSRPTLHLLEQTVTLCHLQLPIRLNFSDTHHKMRENNKDLNTNWQVYYYENDLNYIIEEKKNIMLFPNPSLPKTSPFLRTPPKNTKRSERVQALIDIFPRAKARIPNHKNIIPAVVMQPHLLLLTEYQREFFPSESPKPFPNKVLLLFIKLPNPKPSFSFKPYYPLAQTFLLYFLHPFPGRFPQHTLPQSPFVILLLAAINCNSHRYGVWMWFVYHCCKM